MAMVPHARAEDRLIVTAPTDYWFTFTEETVFVATTYQSGDLPSDPQLWLYAGDLLLFTNDDHLGLQSHIEMTLQPGNYRLRASTCCYEPEVWRDGIVWNIQYELYYTGIQIEPTTTTTIQETTTTIWEPTTTSTEPTTTTTTTAPTTTVPVEEPPTTVETTTTSSSTSTTTTIGSTTVLATVPPTSTAQTVPVTTTLPRTTTTSTTTSSLAPTTTVTTSTPPTEPPTTTTLPPSDSPPPDASSEELVAYLDTVTVEDLATLNTEEITQLVDDIANAELTDEQAEQIAQALTDAPAEVKEAFQEAVNVFGGKFDSYVPTGSTVPVGTRRTLIAVTTATFAASTPISRKKP